MECDYEPYIQITGTTNYPPIRCSSFTKARELESLFQQEKCYDKLSKDRGRKRYSKEKDTGQNRTGDLGADGGAGCYSHDQSTMTPNEYATRAFHERYSGLAPKAFFLGDSDGSKALCLDRKEFEAIVERSRNKNNSDCANVLCSDSRHNEYMDCDDDDEVRRPPPSLTECTCRRPTRERPREPSIHRPPDLCRGRGGGKPGPPRVNACATKATASVRPRWNSEKKIGPGCLRGSCGKPLKCPSQTHNKIPPRCKSKRIKCRLPPIENNNSCHRSKINQPSGCGCCCCCHRMASDNDPSTTSTSNRFRDSNCRATAADSERFRPSGCCTENHSSASQANRGNFLPPICCSDSRTTRQQKPFRLDACDDNVRTRQQKPFRLDACDDNVRPMCDSNVVCMNRPDDYPKINCNGIHNAKIARCTVGERTFKLSAM